MPASTGVATSAATAMRSPFATGIGGRTGAPSTMSDTPSIEIPAASARTSARERASVIARVTQANWRPVLYLIDIAGDPRRAASLAAAGAGSPAGGRLAR